MLFKPQTQRAGSIRIGEPPTAGRNSPRKIDHFQFTLPDKDGKYYPKDEYMHQVYGPEPKYIGPIFLVSDNLVESLNMQLAWWGSNSLKARRRCFKMLNPLGRGVVDDGMAASQLFKSPDGKGLDYRDRVCLSNECPDFISNKCGASLCIKFWLPNSPRLGEYWLAAGSYLAMNAMFGFIEMMRRGLQDDPESNSLIGLSKIPLALVLKQGSVQFKGKDTPVYYPVLTVDRKLIETTREQGIFNALPSIVGNDSKKLITSGKATRKFQQEEAHASVSKGPLTEDDPSEVVVEDAQETSLASIVVDIHESMHEAHAEEVSSLDSEMDTVQQDSEFIDQSETNEPLYEDKEEAKIMPSVEDSQIAESKENEVQDKKSLDTENEPVYNSKPEERFVSHVELFEAELEDISASFSQKPSVDADIEESLAASLVEEEKVEQSTTQENEEKSQKLGSFILLYQVISNGGAEKKEEVLARVPSDFKKIQGGGIWMSEGDEKNDVRFIIDSEDAEAMMIKDGFMGCPWSIGKLRFQLLEKGFEKTVSRLSKFTSP